MSKFKRETRYIVVKIKHFKSSDDHVRMLKLIHELDVPTIGCVVVEHEWPEYETVWGMIQDRVEGRPNELATANERIAGLEVVIKDFAQIELGMGEALAAANERIRELQEAPRKYVQIDSRGPTYCLHGTSSISAFEALESVLAAANERIRVLEEKVRVDLKDISFWQQRAEVEREVSDKLEKALQRMDKMHEMMMAQVNHKQAFYDCECLQEMNGAPIQAARALAEVAAIRAAQNNC